MEANRIGHILHSNCRLKHSIEVTMEGKMEGMGRWGRRRKPLLADL